MYFGTNLVGTYLDRVAATPAGADRNRVRWIKGALAFVEQQIHELTQWIAEQVRDWNRGPGFDRGGRR